MESLLILRVGSIVWPAELSQDSVFPSEDLGIRYTTVLLSHLCSRDQTQILTLAQKAFHQLGVCPDPWPDLQESDDRLKKGFSG